MGCLTVVLKDGRQCEVTPQNFNCYSFGGITIISGDKYYIDKAVGLGAVAPKPKKKAKPKG
jgi:hypothetical protein